MGLDDFMDIETDDDSTEQDTQTTTTTRSVSDDHENPLAKRDSYKETDKGTLSKRGPYGYPDRETFEDTIDGKVDGHDVRFKYYMPIFPHIEPEPKYKRGVRYYCSDAHGYVSCTSVTTLALARINREVIMLDCGLTEKEDCLEHLEDRFGESLNAGTEVTLHMFTNTRRAVKLAMCDELSDLGEHVSLGDIAEAITIESRTQDFRENESGEHDIKKTDHIKEW